MMCYSVQPRDIIFVKGYGFLSFAENMSNRAKNISKNLRDKYSQKLLDHAKKSATDTFKLIYNCFKKSNLKNCSDWQFDWQ